jgi:hypothetical protein
MPVYRPAFVDRLTLRKVVPGRSCPGEQVRAVYRGDDDDLLRVYEGKPYYCGDLGDVDDLGTAYVHGRLAHFYSSPNFDNPDGMFLQWYTRPHKDRVRHKGIQVLIEVRGRDKRRTLRIARSLKLVRDSSR